MSPTKVTLLLDDDSIPSSTPATASAAILARTSPKETKEVGTDVRGNGPNPPNAFLPAGPTSAASPAPNTTTTNDSGAEDRRELKRAKIARSSTSPSKMNGEDAPSVWKLGTNDAVEEVLDRNAKTSSSSSSSSSQTPSYAEPPTRVGDIRGTIAEGTRNAIPGGRGLGPPPSSSSSSSYSGRTIGRKRTDDRLGSLSWHPLPPSNPTPSTAWVEEAASTAMKAPVATASLTKADANHFKMVFTPAVRRRVESEGRAAGCRSSDGRGHVGEESRGSDGGGDSLAVANAMNTADATTAMGVSRGSTHATIESTPQLTGPAFEDFLSGLMRDSDLPLLSTAPKATAQPTNYKENISNGNNTAKRNNNNNNIIQNKKHIEGDPPKQALNKHYLRNNLLNQRQLHNMKNYYTVWCNVDEESNKSHLKKFTCIFTCPVTGEHFPCGRYTEDKTKVKVWEENGFVWYQNTKMATTAAAAKALDCFTYRVNVENNIASNSTNYRCRDAPYMTNKGPSLGSLPSGLVLPGPLVTNGGSPAAAAASTCNTNVAKGGATSIDMAASKTIDKWVGAVERSTETNHVKLPSAANSENMEASKIYDTRVGTVEKSTETNNAIPPSTGNSDISAIGTPPANNSAINPFNPHNATPQTRLIQPHRNNNQNRKLPPPKQELNELYMAMGLNASQIAELKHYYATWYDAHRNPKPHEKKFTCVFTCPLTGERFACGYWENDGGIVVEGSVFWYQNSKLAMNAAAAKALDCFAFRECHGNNDVPILRCCDEPYFRGNAPPLPEPPKGVTLIDSRLQIDKNHPKQGNDQSISTSGPSKSTPVNNTTDSPKAILHQWYTDYWRRISKSFFMASHSSVKQRMPEKDAFTTWSNRKFNSAERRFTSVFICPWTGERFLSGKLIGEINSYSEGDFLFENAHETIKKKLVWYRSKKEAENAAAGRCLDCFRLRGGAEKDDADPDKRRFCVEAPYDSGGCGTNWLQSISGVNDLIWEGKESSADIRKMWKVVDDGDRIPIRYECCSKDGD